MRSLSDWRSRLSPDRSGPTRPGATTWAAAATGKSEARRSRQQCAMATRPLPPFSSAADVLHERRRVAIPRGRALRRQLVEPAQVLLGERDLQRGKVLEQVLPPLGPEDRHDVLAPGPHPRQRELRGRALLLDRDLLDVAEQLEVLGEVLPLEPRRAPAPVVGGEVLESLDLAGEESPPERAVGDEADAQLAARGKRPVLHVAAPQRVLALEGGDGMDPAGAPLRLGSRLRQAEVAHLARPPQLRHG